MADARSSRLASTRLDSTLNSLQSLDKKQSAAFLAVRCIGVQRWNFLSSRYVSTLPPSSPTNFNFDCRHLLFT